MLSRRLLTSALLIATSLTFGPSARATAADDARGKEEQPAEAEKEGEPADAENGEDKDNGDSPEVSQLKANAGIDLPSAHKNVSIVLGAVVLNPFKLTQIEDPAAVRFQLDTGNTEANFLVEAGFRRRWAWLDRISPKQIARRQQELSAQMTSLELAHPTNAQLTDLLSLEEASRNLVAAAKTEPQAEEAARLANDRAKAVQAAADQRAKNLAELKKVSDEHTDLVARHGDLTKPGALPQPTTTVFWPGGIWEQKGGWGFFIPDDWTTRLGFATGSETPSGAAALAGAGDFYIEQGLGWNLARFSLGNSVVALDSRSDEAPFRGAFSFEFHSQFSNDPDLNDLHKRLLVGLSSSIGFSLPRSRDEADPLKPAHIWEIVVRAGAVNVEIPRFLNSSTNEVYVQNQVPDFSGKWGFGLDAEFHIPVLEAGYLTLRGSMNSNFDPNPWTATVGYTLPIGDLLKLIRGS